MPTLTTPRSSQQLWQFETPAFGGIVVGFDGSPASHAALATARIIGEKRNWPVHVISVLRPISTYKFEVPSEEAQSHVQELRIQLRDGLLRDAIGPVVDESEWTRQVVVGHAAEEIANAADRRAADMIIVGQSDCGTIDRALGGETTLKLLRNSPVPVLIVGDEMQTPENLVVAVDFGPASVRAVVAAVKLLGEKGTLYLVHVEQPFEALPDGTLAPDPDEYPTDIAMRFNQLRSKLRTPPAVSVESVILNGAPVPTLLEFCDRVGADLIVAGTHGMRGLRRFLLGSVSKGLLRNATQPILIVPSKE